MPTTQTAPLNLDFGLRDRKVSEADNGSLIISGRASTWDLDRQGDTMSRNAFSDSLKRYMTNPIVLYAHRYGTPMGRTLEAEVRADGLHVKVELPQPEAGTEERRIWDLVKAGVIKAFSVGGKGTRKLIDGVQTVVHWDLRELSIAPVGVNPNTLFSVSAQAGKCFDNPSYAEPPVTPAEATVLARARGAWVLAAGRS